MLQITDLSLNYYYRSVSRFAIEFDDDLVASFTANPHKRSHLRLDSDCRVCACQPHSRWLPGPQSYFDGAYSSPLVSLSAAIGIVRRGLARLSELVAVVSDAIGAF